MVTHDRAETQSASSSPAFHELLADFIARVEAGGSGALDDFRSRHPEFVSQIGHQLDWLADKLDRRKEEGPIPERIGPHRVVKRLGHGGMGDVYLAEQTTPFRRTVAVKVIQDRKLDAEHIVRFASEIQLLAQLNHNGIARVFEAGTAEGRPYFTMEYVPGQGISHYCSSERLDIAERLRLFLDVCRAVEHAHRNGILHRDLKASNILVFGPRDQPVAKIIDFGLAKAIDPEPGRQLTETAHFAGTPDYMSPEQVDLRRSRHVDTRVDVYALGCVLYELLTGELPLSIWKDNVKDHGEIVHRIRELRPTSPSLRVGSQSPADASPATSPGLSLHRLRRLLAGDLDSIVMKAIAKDPDDRYGSVAEFAEDVQRFLRHEPVRSRPHTSGYLLRKFVRRHRAGVAFATTLATLAAASLVTIYLYALDSFRDLERASMFGLARYLEDLRAQEAEPPPARLESQANRAEWLRHVGLLMSQRERMRAYLTSPPATTDRPATETAWARGAYADTMLRQTVQQTLAALDAMAAPGAMLDEVRRRMDWAERVHRESVGRHADAWRRAQSELQNDPRFTGFQLKPQTGLVPLGRDPKTGYQEFAFLLPGGSMPARTDGKIQIGDDTCPVFVLLPGAAEYLVGGQKDNPDGERYDPERVPFEQELAIVTIGPFFASKFEFTNGQWHLLEPGWPASPDEVLSASRHPLVFVAGTSIRHVLSAWGMRLPTSDEWEYMARGDTHWPRWCGRDTEHLRHKENLYDQSLVGSPGRRAEGEAVPWDDGYPATAPVGSLEPNPFGLWDMLGNAGELALSLTTDTKQPYDLRGSSWRMGSKAARATSRTGWAGNAAYGIGFRPVIVVQP